MDKSSKIYSIDEIKEYLYNYLDNQNYYEVNKVILFGSYAKNSADCMSDLDLIVIDSPNFNGLKVYSLIDEIKNIFNKSIDLFSEYQIDKSSNFYKNIIKEGIVVYEK